jgi:small-conductance mechanosensitive channel
MHRFLTALLVVLLIAGAAGLVLTSDWRAQAKRTSALKSPHMLVDVRPLRTAKKMALMARTPNEVALAQEALRVADREVDLAFAMELQAADDAPPPTDEKTVHLKERVTRRQKRLADAQAQVAGLTKQVAQATGSRKDLLQDQLEEAQAWEDVAQNSLDDAKIDLQRAGGDRHAQIQEMQDQHDASEHEGGPSPGAGAAGPATAAHSSPAIHAGLRGLIGQVQQWSALRDYRKSIQDAQQDAREAVTSLKKQHDELAAGLKVPAGEPAGPGEGAESQPATPGKAATLPSSKDEAVARLARTRHLTGQQRRLLGLNRRARLQDELAGVYAQWSALVADQGRAAIHSCLKSLVALLFVALVTVGIDGWLARFFSGLGPQRVRVLTIRRVARVAVQTTGIVVVLLILFGPPSQLAVFLGFAGAGLTIALKDFIVGFFGWFVLMGKDGLRVGDWVEINGVTGEVVDIGPMHTVLLETGNWTDAGHPTGRRVTFVNSFAIEGHYFNFSTSGQWLWDEVVATLPQGHDPYPVVDAIRKIVAEETHETARLAEEEWSKSARTRGLTGFSETPAITVRPAGAGLEVVVRYVTRASERHSLRARLYQALVDLIGGRAPGPARA